MHTLRNIAVFIFLFVSLHTVAQKRFKSEVFSVIDSVSNIKYGQAVNIKGDKEELLLDIFTPPKSDTLQYRPLIIFIHGG